MSLQFSLILVIVINGFYTGILVFHGLVCVLYNIVNILGIFSFDVLNQSNCGAQVSVFPGSAVISSVAIKWLPYLKDNLSSSVFFGSSLWVPNRARVGPH